MVKDLQELMHQSVAAPPPDRLDVSDLVREGRRRARRRRTAAVGGVGAVAAAVAAVAVTAIVWPQDLGTGDDGTAGRPPAPDAPTLRLSDAERAVEGRDLQVLTSYTNENLNRDNGQYFDGVTADGMVLFRDGPRADQPRPRFALLEPTTGEKEWLPDLPANPSQTWPVELGRDRLVLLAGQGGMQGKLVAHVYDRRARQWVSTSWPELPGLDYPDGTVGPDGRLYVRAPASRGRPPAGGWPIGEDGEADDADAEGDTYDLWSVSLTDGSDARDEQLSVGEVAFTEDSLIWTDRTNGDPGAVHVRNLATGEEDAFDPRTGERCNLLSFGAFGDRVVLGQYCGTYDGGVRDDRVQVLSTDGEQVVTVQDSGLDGGLATAGTSGAGGVVSVTVHEGQHAGAYAYDLATGRFLRLSDAVSMWGLGGPVPEGQVLWHTPTNQRRGATQWLGRLVR
ncbi:hypothetical protein [Nocardioides sp. SYSU DS0663]|uniref:hypothetical protein n=1 Tax=Nocardioides sp. SYSU DS0663 TaxID=3416445 RepID=UPI003F4C950A